MAIAQCYAKCISGWERAESTRIALDALDGEWSVPTLQYVTCLLAQSDASRADACRAGCLDIEIAYEVRSSHIRYRYHRLLNEHLREVRASGLWYAWNRYPAVGTDEFARACARHLQITNSLRSKFASAMDGIKPESEADLKARIKKVREEEYVPPLPNPTDFEFHTSD